MLMLTRRKDEGIWIGDEIRIVVIAIEGNSVRIGIEAPQDIPIHRDEVRQGQKNGRGQTYP